MKLLTMTDNEWLDLILRAGRGELFPARDSGDGAALQRAVREIGELGRRLDDTLDTLMSVLISNGAGVSQSEHYERMSEQFHRDTGYTAPGKADPLYASDVDHQTRRRAAWNKWREQKSEAIRKLISDAVNRGSQ